MEKKLSEVWDDIHMNYIASYDDWLEPYEHLFIDNKASKVIELGCGRAYTSVYLKTKGFKDVVACDFSPVVLEKLKVEQPELKTMLFDMVEELPFKENSVDIVLADLCLHYFDDKTTKQIIDNIFKILKPGGYILGRVNSTKDVAHGANQGEKIEDNFYFVGNMYKRFFEKKDFEHYFSDWKEIDLQEEKMTRYVKPKTLWSFAYQKR